MDNDTLMRNLYLSRQEACRAGRHLATLPNRATLAQCREARAAWEAACTRYAICEAAAGVRTKDGKREVR